MGGERKPHLLVIRLSAMGDVAMVSHVIESFRKANPGVGVTLMTRPFFGPFFREIEGVNLLAADFSGRHKSVIGLFRLRRELKAYGVTHVADLHNVLRTKFIRLLMIFSGARISVINKERREKRALSRKKYKFKVQLKQTVERYREAITSLGFSCPVPEPRRRKVRKIPAGISVITGTKKGIWVGYAPFAKHKGKIYDLDKSRAAISALAGIYENVFVFGGGRFEKSFAEEIEGKHENVISVIGKTDLPGELDLISNLDVMVSMDSSAMHMASLEGVPVVSVWGATHPFAGFYGYGQDPDNTVQLTLPCRPCSIYGSRPCRYRDYHCMKDIEPELVVDRVREFLERNTGN